MMEKMEFQWPLSQGVYFPSPLPNPPYSGSHSTHQLNKTQLIGLAFIGWVVILI